MIQGFISSMGSENYIARFSSAEQAAFFRRQDGISLSSLGIGTYLGEMDDTTDQISEEAIRSCLEQGVNVIDSAINYRGQRSERVIGKVIADLIDQKKLSRDEIFISTKGGFIPFDGNYPENPSAYFQNTYIHPGILKADEVVQGCHAMTPRYLEDQVERSLKNLGVETIDLYYLHNPETQLEEVSEDEFYNRLAQTFEFFETQVAKGKIKKYGMATWNGCRVTSQSRGYLSLKKVLETAKAVGGEHHHFKALQLPYNLGMPEAFAIQNQLWDNEWISSIEFARRAGLMVFTSASLLQGRLAKKLPDRIRKLFSGCTSDAACALQFVRSTPGVTTALIGMKLSGHIFENLELLGLPPLTPAAFENLFTAQN